MIVSGQRLVGRVRYARERIVVGSVLAQKLELPFHETLVKTVDRPEQKTMNNSAQQARNVDGSLAVRTGPLPEGPVLLVDDMVDSRWTFTECAFVLRAAGSGPVFPVALATTAGAGDAS